MGSRDSGVRASFSQWWMPRSPASGCLWVLLAGLRLMFLPWFLFFVTRQFYDMDPIPLHQIYRFTAFFYRYNIVVRSRMFTFGYRILAVSPSPLYQGKRESCRWLWLLSAALRL